MSPRGATPWRQVISLGSPHVEFYRRRTRVAANIESWAKAAGVKPGSARLLASIIRRSHPAEPWTWVRIDSMESWAKSWGMSLRTLHRQLTDLHSTGLVVSDVRAVSSIKKAGLFPVYTVPESVINDVEDYIGRGSECAKVADSECQNGTLGPFPILPPNPRDTAFLGDFAESHVGVDSKKEMVTTRSSRRLRRRMLQDVISSPVIVQEDEMVSPRNIGIGGRPIDDSPKKLSGPQKPSSRLAEHFEEQWGRVVRSVDQTRLPVPLPLYPWSMGGKQRFYAWVNRHLLLAVGDEATARELITLWCDQLISREIPMPTFGQSEVYWLFSRDLDRVRTIQAHSLVRSVSDHEMFLAEQQANQEAKAARLAAQAPPVVPATLAPELRVVGE